MGHWSERTVDDDAVHDLVLELLGRRPLSQPNASRLARGLEREVRDGRCRREVAGAALVLVDMGMGRVLSSALVAWSVARLRVELEELELSRWRNPPARQRQVRREIRALQSCM